MQSLNELEVYVVTLSNRLRPTFKINTGFFISIIDIMSLIIIKLWMDAVGKWFLKLKHYKWPKRRKRLPVKNKNRM